MVFELLSGQIISKPLADTTRSDIQYLIYKLAKANVDDIWAMIQGIVPVGGDIVEAIAGYVLNWVANRYLGHGIARDVVLAIAAALFEDATDKIFEGLSSGALQHVLALAKVR